MNGFEIEGGAVSVNEASEAALEEEVWFVSGGARLYGIWAPAQDGARTGAAVVLSHGLSNNHKDAPLFGLLRARLWNAGVDVFCFDYFGSGRSDGEVGDKTVSVMRRNFSDALDLAIDEFGVEPSLLGIFGRSVGATVAGYFARDPRVRCSVLASTVFHPTLQFGPYADNVVAGRVPMPSHFVPSGQLKGKWAMRPEFFAELETAEAELAAAVTQAERVMVVHGESDPKVGLEQSRALMDLLAEPKAYVGVVGGDHDYNDHEDEIVTATQGWLERWLR